MRVPSWYWPWVRWRLGEGEFKGDPRNPARRPEGVPKVIPVWAWQKLARFLARRKVVQRPGPSPLDSLVFWRRMGVWVTRIDHFPPEWLSSYSNGQYAYVVVPCLYGVEMESHTEHLDQYVEECQRRGFKVAGSQWGQAGGSIEAITEARAAANAVRKFGFDAWVMNGEKNYEGRGRSGAYVLEFRRHQPMLPFGWSPEPRLSLDHTLMQQQGVCYMPQAYPLENRKDVKFCVDWGLEFGYRPENIVPLVQAYPAPTGDRWLASHYRDQAREAGIPGLVLYTANQAADVPQYWRELVV